jgi:hypothetical protein
VVIGLFEAIETIGQALVVNLNNLLDSFRLKKKIIAFVQNEGANLNVMIQYYGHCDLQYFKLEESFNGSYFRHFFPRHANMGLSRKKFIKTWDSCQLRMHNLTFKSALLGQKILVRESSKV